MTDYRDPKRFSGFPALRDPPSAPVREVAKAIIGLIPGLPSMYQLIFEQVWEDPKQVAMKNFVIALAEKVEELDSVDLKYALERPEAKPLLVQAFETASKSFGDRKLEALRNATIEGAFKSSYDFDLSAIVLSLLDRLTEGHIEILQALNEHKSLHGIDGMPEAQLANNAVRTYASDAGMKDPQEVLFDEGGFIDRQHLRVNQLIIDDLKSMGLVENKGGRVVGILAPSIDGSENVTRDIRITEKGWLLYQHIFPEKADS